MWWECSECGDQIERARAPLHCRECGIAGAIFVPAEVRDRSLGFDDEDLRVAWLRRGAELARAELTGQVRR
jgi:hypothetical protein